MTLPEAWRSRRLQVPDVLRLHHADVPVTKPARTLRDCVAARLQPDLVRQALEQALERGRVAAGEIADVQVWLDGWRRG